jgi:hypothetical protein
MIESQIINAARLLTESSTGYTIGQLCAAVGLKAHIAGNRTYLKKGLFDYFGAKLTMTNGVFQFCEATKASAARVKFEAPADLWRGWIDPVTGIVPPRLGLDPLKEKSE